MESLSKYRMQGTVVDTSNNPLIGVLISTPYGDISKTNNKGVFTLLGEFPEGETFMLNISNPKYAQSNITPFFSDGTIKDNIGVVTLKTIDESLVEDTQQNLLLTQSQSKLLTSSKLSFDMIQQQALNGVATQVKTILIPLVLTEIAKFGISKASDIISDKIKNQKTNCPTPTELQIIINKKNRLVKQLNNIYKVLERVKIAVQLVDGIITASQIVIKVIKAVPAPASAGAAAVLIDIENRLKKFKIISSSVLVTLVILIEALKNILEYLNLLDTLIQDCSQGQISQEQISNELILLTQETSKTDPVVTNVNGFTMGVETELTEKPLKRRRATATNKQGITMLKGEWSFSSSDQILIDELVFYIQQNDLKAD